MKTLNTPPLLKMPIEFIDSHAHLSSPDVYKTIGELISNAQHAGIVNIINICTDIQTLENGLALRKQYPWIYNTASTTPHDVDAEGEAVFPKVVAAAKSGALVAIGETGLDYFHHHSKPETQKEFLRRYLHLALECQLPVVIHCREAFTDFFNILDAEYMINSKHAPGVLHCFTGTMEEAEQVIKRGWYLSISGIATFKKSEGLREVAKRVPLDQLLIETDTPYLAPQSKRGKQNEPAFLVETAACIAAARGITLEELASATTANAKRLFKL